MNGTGSASPLIEVLASGRQLEHSAEWATFGQFVGTWRLAWTGFNPSGPSDRAVGELAFDWILGGRAVQDVWIVPGRDQPGSGLPPRGFYGTTIRFYDPTIEAWRSTWINPVTGGARRFIGQRNHDGIELLSTEQPPWLRWRFADITADSFRWTGDYSTDGGLTWTPDDEMVATRVP